ncbi:cystathionine beta-lyase [Maricaulaceae bacterium EIL42A08]|nr:cystathionine beta-lyase [Maricaulaceae bacterium EIL42A08]
MKRETRLIHAGRPKGDKGLVNAPVDRASTVLAPTTAELYNPTPPRRHYARGGLSPNAELREALCGLYGADHCALASSGLAAVILAIRSAIEGPGEVLVSDTVYAPVRRFCNEELPRLGVSVTYYDPRIGADIEKLITRETRAILLESPGSLTFEVQDLPAICKVAEAHGVRTAIDDTWTAGLLMNPLDLGVDFAAQSLTKYVGGHSDFLAGAVVARGSMADELKTREGLYGQHMSPDDGFLALRGLRTLSMRLERSGASGLEIAKRLEALPKIARVLHPGLESHPDHTLFKRDFSGAAGCFSFVLDGINARDGEAMIEQLKLFGIGFSWGGYESLVMPCDRQLKRTAVPWKGEGALIRLSIGLEDVEDLWSDLERLLA